MNLDIYIHPNDVLRDVCPEVTDFGEDTARDCGDLVDTILHTRNGVGLAAPQVGIRKRIIIVHIDGSLVEMINPKIIASSGEQFNMEGCLSVPHYYSKIKRAMDVTVEYQDIDGEFNSVSVKLLEAVEIQHEIDHLNGILFIDHLPQIKQRMFRDKYRNILKQLKSGKLKRN